MSAIPTALLNLNKRSPAPIFAMVVGRMGWIPLFNKIFGVSACGRASAYAVP